jgi:hypothetical protein
MGVCMSRHGLGLGLVTIPARELRQQRCAQGMGRRVGFGVTPTLLLPKKKYTFGAGEGIAGDSP